MKRLLAVTVLLVFLAAPVMHAQFSSSVRWVGTINFDVAESPFGGTLFTTLIVEVDRSHPGPEHLVFWLGNAHDGASGVLSIAIHDHPTKHFTFGMKPGAGICAEPGQPVNRNVTNWDAVDVDGDGIHDYVRLWELGPFVLDRSMSIYKLGPLDACKLP